MATVHFILGIICTAFISRIDVPDRHLLAKSGSVRSSCMNEQNCRRRLVQLAVAEIGVREKTNRNDGKRVEEYLSVVNLRKGQPYCSAFISWLFAREGFTKPRTGWSPDLFPQARLARSALPANIIGIYFPGMKRIAHTGMIEKMIGSWCQTVEANTSLTGSRSGDGVYRKLRHLRTIYRISDWVSPERAGR